MNAVVMASLFALAPGAEKRLGLDEVLTIAAEHNRSLVAAEARVAQAQTQITQAWTALLPILTAQGKYTHNYKEVVVPFADPGQPAPVILKKEALDTAAHLTVPVIVPAAYVGLIGAGYSVGAQEANFATSEATILFQVAQTFYGAAGADELTRVSQHAIEVAKPTLDNAQARFDAGTVNRVELTRAQLALVRAEQALVEATDSRAQVYRSLATLIVYREPFQVAPAEIGRPHSNEEVAALVTSALEHRPEIAALERSIAANDAQESAALWRWAPSISAFGSARAFNYAGFSGDKFDWAVGAQIDWTIFDAGGRIAEEELAEEQRHENEAKLSELKDTVADEVANAQQQIETKTKALEAAKRAVDLSSETLELVRAQYDAGTATQLDLLQAQDALISSEVSVARARFDLALAELQLERSAGLFPPRKE